MNRFANDGSFLRSFKTEQNVRSADFKTVTSSAEKCEPIAIKSAVPASGGTRITAKAAFGSDSDEDDDVKKPAKKHATAEKTSGGNPESASAAVSSTQQQLSNSDRKRSRWDVNEFAARLQQPSFYAEKTVNVACNPAQNHAQPTTAVHGSRRPRKRTVGKLEYDSDEEIDPIRGTWEHKRRFEEMQRTAAQATPRLHRHIGDYLPPEELQKFTPRRTDHLQAAVAPSASSTPNTVQQISPEKKIDDSNVGFKLLAKMGWKDGSGLGASSQGRQEPIAAVGDASKVGLGAKTAQDEATESADEFELYRRRMQTAYKYRPNPLNNPRRQYY